MSTFQLLPELTEQEYADLEADIVANGVLQPILVDEHGRVIDGHHRQTIAAAHGLRCPQIKCPPNLSERDKRRMALGVNLHRRHLTNEQKREVIRNALLADPELSNRQHADDIGVSHHTVAKERKELESGGQMPTSNERTGADGKTYPAHVTTTTRTTEATKIERDIDLDTGEIVDPAPPHGIERPDPQPEVDPDREEAKAVVEAIAESNYPESERIADQFRNALASARRGLLMTHTAADLAGALDEDDVIKLNRFIGDLADLSKEIHTTTSKPSGLRVVQGGQR